MKWEFHIVKSNCTLDQQPAVQIGLPKRNTKYLVPLCISGLPTQRDLAIMEEYSTSNLGWVLADLNLNKVGLFIVTNNKENSK